MEIRKHHYHSLFRRATYSLVIIITVLSVGTLGFHAIEHYSYINSFYVTSMIATGQGPPTAPITNLGKIFASVMAFVSIGSVVFALGFLFGPFFGRLLKIGEEKLKKEEEALARKR